jgi:SAM-dependent methyltransferase
MAYIDGINQEELFDNIAEDYDLLLENWESDLLLQGRQLDVLIKQYATIPVTQVLDCTCGIGTQCIGLAKQGYRTTGIDISGKSIRRATREADRFGVAGDFLKADIRHLDQAVTDRFDCVISCDNSLPALLTAEDLAAGVEQMYQRLKPSGLCVISIRDYARIFEEKRRFHPRRIHQGKEGRIIIFDLWDYPGDQIVVCEVFYLKESPQGWRVVNRKMVLRAIFEADLVALLEQVGFKNIHIDRDLKDERFPFDYYVCRK